MTSTRPAWHQRAACIGQPLSRFFPKQGESAEPAREVCRRCPVTAECLAEAYERGDQYGVWGGLSPVQRGVRDPRRDPEWARRPKPYDQHVQRMSARGMPVRTIAEHLGISPRSVSRARARGDET